VLVAGEAVVVVDERMDGAEQALLLLLVAGEGVAVVEERVDSADLVVKLSS